MCESLQNRKIREQLEKWGKKHLEELEAQKRPKGSEKFIEVMNLVGDKMRISRMVEAFESIYPAFPNSWTLLEVRRYLEDTSVKYDERIRKALDKGETG